MYYNARYYDPALGTFISPDSMVPGAGQVINYNRFLYAKGNPLKYTDPTGHAGYDPFSQDWIDAFKAAHGGEEPDAADRVDRLISLSHPGPVERKATWTEFDWHYYTRNKMWVLAGVISVTGIKIDRSWDVTDRKERDNLTLLLEGMIEFGYTVGKANGGGLEAGLAQLGEMLDGPTYWGRGASGWGLCAHSDTQACAPGRWVNFYDKLFNSGYDDTYIRTAVAHEMAHVLHNTSCATVMGMPKICELQFGLFLGIGFGLEGFGTYELTTEAQQNHWEYWAEAVTI